MPRLRAVVGSPLWGAVLLVLYTVLALVPNVPDLLVILAAVGPVAWLVRTVWEILRLVQHKSTPMVVLAYTALLVGLTITEYATLYNWQSQQFDNMTTRFAPLYFSITTFTTTGFGDIVAHTQGAQILVSTQMILDWSESAVIVAIVLAILLNILGTRYSQSGEENS